MTQAMPAGRAAHLLLLIDPDEGVRESLSDQLEQEGFTPASLASVGESVVGEPALILLGPGALGAVELAGWRPPAPVIALIDAGQEEIAVDPAFAAWLVRPVRIAELVALIERL